jgi:hypothetical protein
VVGKFIAHHSKFPRRYQVNDKLSFDIGLRYAWVDGQRPVNEIRLSLTFGIPMLLGAPSHR